MDSELAPLLGGTLQAEQAQVYNFEAESVHCYGVGQQSLPVRKGSANITTVDKVALGPFGAGNERSFWVALVERKKLHHLGFIRAEVSSLRNSLALGELLFHEGPGGMAQFKFIEDKTREFLTGGRLKRIYFDLTNLDTLSGAVNEGRFAFVELKLILDTETLFRITSFYKDGKYLRMTLEGIRRIVSKLLEGKV